MMFRWDVVAKAHEFVAKINKLTPEKVKERFINAVLVNPLCLRYWVLFV